MLLHVLAIAAYAVVAAGVAAGFRALAPEVGHGAALALGGVAFALAVALHEVAGRRAAVAAVKRELAALRREHDEAAGEVRAARAEIARLFEALTGGEGRGVRDLEKDVDKIVDEVRLLQGLVTQLQPREAAIHGQTRDQLVAEILDTAPVARAALRPGDGQRAVDHGAAGRRPGEASPPRDTALRSEPGGLDDAEILRIIRNGLRQDRVDLVLQPIVSLPQRKRKFYEAFTRIRSGDGATILPEQYIAIAEREGLITAIDNMLLFRCVQLLRVTHKKNRSLGFFCNISPYTLADRAFFRDFVAFMAGNAELAPNLVFEFAQSTIANRDEEIERQLARLAGMGFRYSIDQVASLNLDLASLARRNFRFVKIDAQTLLAEATGGAPQLPIDVKDFKRALDRQGIDLIVEKVEDERTLLDLLDFNIDYGQGYLFGEPKDTRAA
jgi:cyclic-di-GMP phosphodiesterase TipF (flagellum assembly factor)